MGKDIFPRLAAKLDSAIATDVISIDVSDDKILAKKPVFAGKAISTLELAGTSPKLVTVRLNTFSSENGEATVEVETLATETRLNKT